MGVISDIVSADVCLCAMEIVRWQAYMKLQACCDVP